jgi:signal peptidase I
VSRAGAARARARAARALVGWLVTLGAVLTWWVWFAPVSAGGTATYVLVYGTSMEPTIKQGDLVIARPQTQYRAGDVAVFLADVDMFVIHRLVERQSGDWISKGDNLSEVDPWLAPEESIVAGYWVRVPAVAGALAWWQDHPYSAAAGVSAIALLSYLPWRRRRITPALAVALANAIPEPRQTAGPGARGNRIVLALSVLATVASVLVVTEHALRGSLSESRAQLAVAGLAVAITLTAGFAYRVFDGVGAAEPVRSLTALSGRLRRVIELPPHDEANLTASAIELRTLAERHRLPVLHHVDPVTGVHEFLVMTARHGDHMWRAVPALRRENRRRQLEASWRSDAPVSGISRRPGDAREPRRGSARPRAGRRSRPFVRKG